MREEWQGKTTLRLAIENAVMRRVYKSGKTFTIAQLCEEYGFKDTRYLRTIVRELVGEGVLWLIDTGDKKTSTPKRYCAQKTVAIEAFTDHFRNGATK